MKCKCCNQGMKIISTYKDLCTVYYCSECEKIQVETELDIIGAGMDRVVYKIDDSHILKVARNLHSVTINQHEVNVFNKVKDKVLCIKPNTIYEYDKENYTWYVAEMVKMSGKAMNEALNIILPLDCAENAGYDKDGKLTVVDYENIHWTWFVESENPYSVNLDNPNEMLNGALSFYSELTGEAIKRVIGKIKQGILKVIVESRGMTIVDV